MKFILALACALLPFVTIATATTAAKAPPAQLLNGSAVFSIEGKAAPLQLTDNVVTTIYQPAGNGEELVITAQEPVAAVYIRFAQPPQPYTATAGSSTVSCGSYGFLHELITLQEPSTEVVLRLPQTGICDVLLYSAGELPKDVEQWQPPYEQCDMLIFPTHADDDVLYMGAAVADAVARGKRVQVAYLTHHWADPLRPHELLAGLWEMGVTAYPIIGQQPDRYTTGLEHARTIFDESKLLAYQVEQLRRFRPFVVLGHDIGGEYGHGMHMLGAKTLLTATEQSADPLSHPESAAKYGVWQVPKAYLHLGEQNQLVLNVDTPLALFGGRTAFEVAKDAFEHHKSQHGWDLAVTTYGHADCRRFSLVHSTVGEDSGRNDLFENIVVPPAKSESEAEDTTEQEAFSGSDEVSSTPSQPTKDTVTQLPLLLISALAAAAFIGIILLIVKPWKRKY